VVDLEVGVNEDRVVPAGPMAIGPEVLGVTEGDEDNVDPGTEFIEALVHVHDVLFARESMNMAMEDQHYRPTDPLVEGPDRALTVGQVDVRLHVDT
jgi:hypothetical protein